MSKVFFVGFHSQFGRRGSAHMIVPRALPDDDDVDPGFEQFGLQIRTLLFRSFRCGPLRPLPSAALSTHTRQANSRRRPRVSVIRSEVV